MITSQSARRIRLDRKHRLEKASSAEKPTVIDVFSGVGGMSLGAIRAGFRLALAIEKDPHIAKAHKLNFPTVRHLEDDVSLYSGAALLKAAGLKKGELTGLIGGPPCQGFSTIGHRNRKDARNELFNYFFKLVAETKPKFFLAENVLGILSDKFSKQRLAALDLVSGYELLPPLRVKANQCGAATTRERVFFVGYDNTAHVIHPCCFPFTPCVCVRAIFRQGSSKRSRPPLGLDF